MAYAKKKRQCEAKWGGGPFVALSRQFQKSKTLADLSPYGAKLLLDLIAAYNGYNNGDLSVAWKLMQLRGWRSKATLTKARDELLAKGVLRLTRQGGRRWASLYALTLYWIDECKGKRLECGPTFRPSNDWLLLEPVKPIEQARAEHKATQQSA